MKYKTISDCPRCKGAIMPYRSHGFIKTTAKLYQCFQCSRIYYWNNGWHKWSLKKEWDEEK